MNESSREYIECRLFILGDEKVGKKSFVNKIQNLPCTTIIRNIEAEEEYNRLYSEMQKSMEKEKLRQQQQEELLKSISEEKKQRIPDDITSKLASTKTLLKIDEDKKSFSRKPSQNLNNMTGTNRNITSNNSKINNTNSNSSTIIYPSHLISKKIFRPPVPENPAKLYCINLDKIVIKIYCIPKADKQDSDLIPREDEEGYGLEKEHNISFDGIRKDLNEKLGIKDTVIAQEKLSGFNTSVFTLFVFLYDLSSFYSFESLILYYSTIAKVYHLEEEENFRACIVGNKKDKKVSIDSEQESVFNEFLKNTQLKKFEVSTKPYFSFDKFFIEFFFQNFSMFYQSQAQTEIQGQIKNQKANNTKQKINLNEHNLFNDNHFIEEFKKIITNKSNFSRSERNTLVHSSYSPGPEYNINLYSFNSIEEIKEIFHDKKSRFNKKIFANKRGPVFVQEKKEYINKNKDKDIFYNIPIIGGLFNKPINGYSFGIVKGKLKLLNKRKELRDQRNYDLQENINSYNNSPVNKKPLKLSKDEEYFENVLKRKNNLFHSVIKERQLKLGKIISRHNENLKKLEMQKELNDSKVFKHQKIDLQKSSSCPNILFNSISYIDEIKEKKKNKQRYLDIIYGRNKENIEKYNTRLSQLALERSSFENKNENEYSPENSRIKHDKTKKKVKILENSNKQMLKIIDTIKKDENLRKKIKNIISRYKRDIETYTKQLSALVLEFNFESTGNIIVRNIKCIEKLHDQLWEIIDMFNDDKKVREIPKYDKNYKNRENLERYKIQLSKIKERYNNLEKKDYFPKCKKIIEIIIKTIEYLNHLLEIKELFKIAEKDENKNDPLYKDLEDIIITNKKIQKDLWENIEKFNNTEKLELGPKRIKDDFDKIVQNVRYFKPQYSERFVSSEKEILRREEEIRVFEEFEKKEEEKRQKMELNREKSDRVLRFQLLKYDRKNKFEKQQENYKNKELKREEIQEIRREIAIQKGYGDPFAINPINYSLVEESPPKYSIKGRIQVHEVKNDDPGNLVLGINPEKIEFIREAQKNQPQPNYNYIKPRLPSAVFSKAERFPKIINQYEDSVLLFEDGIFQPNTRQDFICKEPMNNYSLRSGIVSPKQNLFPSPAEYKIKSKFDIIAEEGRKISSIHQKIKNKKSLELKKRNEKRENQDKNDNIIILNLENDS